MGSSESKELLDIAALFSSSTGNVWFRLTKDITPTNLWGVFLWADTVINEDAQGKFGYSINEKGVRAVLYRRPKDDSWSNMGKTLNVEGNERDNKKNGAQYVYFQLAACYGDITEVFNIRIPLTEMHRRKWVSTAMYDIDVREPKTTNPWSKIRGLLPGERQRKQPPPNR